MNIGIVGTGYVGLVTGLCFAELGNKVLCADNNAVKIENLQKGEVPFFEAGLDELLSKHLTSKNIEFTTDVPHLAEKCDVIFIAVGTPSNDRGEYDLSSIEHVAQALAEHLEGYTVIAVKSTVTVGCTDAIADVLSEKHKEGKDFDIAFCPEFLSEGQAVHGFMNPYRTVIGTRGARAAAVLKKLHESLNRPILHTGIRDAEMIKLASNVFLATKISYVNELARICELLGADIKAVTKGMGFDPRIGSAFLNAGTGFGGPCLRKDTLSLTRQAEKQGYDPKLLDAVIAVNESIPSHIIARLSKQLGPLSGSTVAVLGLAFKAGTSDMRDSQSLVLIEMLIENGATVRAYDPKATEEAQHYKVMNNVDVCATAHDACQADAAVLMTEWPEFMELDLTMLAASLTSRVLVDARNLLGRDACEQAGLIYQGMGR